MCFNNPISGTKFNYIPDTGNIPLVADMTTYLLSEPIDVTKFGLIYAAGKANIGPSGITVVIVRDDLIGRTLENTPSILDYKLLSETDYDFNTPPIFSIYVAGLIFKWIESVGGIEEMKRRNEKKASLIYDFIDARSDYYTSPVDRSCRSLTNIRFLTGSYELDKKFIKEAERRGLKNLQGHASLGGMNASIYNAMPYEGVVELVDFMNDFALKNPKYELDME
jgi:phosphoserine aminotransferase